MGDSQLSYELRDSVAVIRMDDGKVNVLTAGMMNAVSEALGRAEKEASAVVLLGREGRFSGGFDLKRMKEGSEVARQVLTEGGEFLVRLYEHPQPVVVGCTGHAMAGGALALLAADVRVGAEGDFLIGLNEVAIGIQLPILAIELARDRLESSRFHEATLFAQTYPPKEALTVGYLDIVVEASNVESASVEVAKQLCQLDARAYAGTKRSMRRRLVKYARETLDQDLLEVIPG